MPTKIEKDAISGTDTTGHEWDGIRELNTPLPKWWLYLLFATVLFSVVYWVLFPAIPGLSGYTKGLLGYNQRTAFETQLAAAQAEQARYLDRIHARSVTEIAADPELRAFAVAGGRAAFGENCAACHGLGGAGRPGGFPVLADDDWLWGGTLDDIHATITHGVRQDDPDTRTNVMPSFGADGLLTAEEMNDVAEYVLSLSGRAGDATAAGRGAAVFADNCASCHGEDGKGQTALGAPDLTDAIWLYAADKAGILRQINKPAMGQMPAWGRRLSPETIKMLTLYVHDLGGGQ
ncbi:MAG: cytochrome-c oxidase, cbb3-type subunit III [Rhodospirillaceae bacterium]|nr:cytochrome-c oxidase, cbb3-type subunit III [Rhodospirillaceae bacterium]